MIRGLVALALVAGATTARAAPWSFELPAGYVEQAGAADGELDRLRAAPRTVSVDGQVYLSPRGDVRLARLTWLSRFDPPPRRALIESLDKGVSSGAGKRGTIVSESRELVGDQLVGDQVIDVGDVRIHARRLYAAGRDHVVTLFAITCAGAKDALAACEHAQRTMRLVLPDAASLSPVAEDETRAADIAALVAGLAIAFVVLYLLARGRHRAR